MEDGPRERERITEVVDEPLGAAAPTEPEPPGGLGVRSPGAKLTLPDTSYELGAAIGRGGMGEVIAAIDRRIGREVAIKRMRSAHASPEATARFLREARIQAWLDHPAVVPVFELGADEAGRPYFTMKRLSGHTLAQQISEGVPQRRLLRAYVDVCLAIERAHARGVVHRDLKPSNIMLGDYGEVYVIDWGIARLMPEAAAAMPEVAPAVIEPATNDPDAAEPAPGTTPAASSEASTRTGTVLGTPGYISPEQLKGDPAGLPADVYSLGAILFELLAGETLHPRPPQKAIASTLATPQEAPARRRPDRAIPPELDRICHDALAEEPASRPTAHQLAYLVQAYLDGDRDVEQRRTLAARQLRSARDVLASGAPDARATALRRAARALALDPESGEAGDLVGALLLEPPDLASSPLLAASLDHHERQIARDRSRKAVAAYLSVFLLLPAIAFVEIKSWPLLIATYATFVAGAISSWVHMRRGRPSVPVSLAITLALAIMFTRIAGPFVLTPLLVCCAIAGLTSIPAVAERRWLVMAWTITAVMSPFVLERLGVLGSSWEVTGRAIESSGDMFYARGDSTGAALVFTNLLFTLVVAWLALEISRRRLSAQRQVYIQAWHLGQLAPSAATGIPASNFGRPRSAVQ